MDSVNNIIAAISSWSFVLLTLSSWQISICCSHKNIETWKQGHNQELWETLSKIRYIVDPVCKSVSSKAKEYLPTIL